MGNLMQRNNEGVEEVDIASTNAYRFPPKSGSYFGSHFIMGGVRFDTIQPEAYLFGENNDLNFLGNRPIPFPYPAPQPGEPTKTLKSLVNIRKDSLRLVKVSEAEGGVVEQAENTKDKSPEKDKLDKRDSTATLTESLASVETVEKEIVTEPEQNETEEVTPNDDSKDSKYNIEFTFDCDARCAVTVFYFATEEISNGHAIYHPRFTSMNSETYHYKKGANQTFNQATHIIQPGMYSEEEWQYSPEREAIPVVIQCVVEDEEHIGHSHMTFGTIEKATEGYALKPLKQKQMVDGLCYLLQEIYGIENKATDSSKGQGEDEYDDMGSECVICMCDIRDTLILPCRHLCLCNGCADSLRYQANNCPICRSPFRALLQVRAMQKKIPNAPERPEDDEFAVSQEGVPTGYEAVSLIEALNGPLVQSPNDGTRRTTSPTGSPHVERRRSAKRLSSAGSTSLRGSVVHEEVETVRADCIQEERTGDGRGTPEVVMSGKCEEPVKHDQDVEKRGRSKSAKKKPAVNGEGDKVEVVQDTVEVVNELKQVDCVDDLELGAEAAYENPVNNDDDDDTPVNSPTEEAVNEDNEVKPLPAHTNVIYDPKEERDESRDDDDVNPLMPDPMSLPGTPITDGSSFNSTCSAKALLPQPYKENKHSDDDAVV